MTTERQLLQEIAQHRQEIAALELKIVEKRAASLISCVKCKHKTAIKNLTFIKPYSYIRPYGCTGGDYYVESSGYYVCQRCGHHNDEYSNSRLTKLKNHFGNIRKKY